MKRRILSMLLMMIFVFTTMTAMLTVSASAATSVALNETSVTIAVGESYTLKLSGAAASKVKWSTSKKTVATVKSGKVTGKKAGTTTITAKYNSKSYKCTVKVVQYRVTGKNTYLTKGSTMQLSVKGKTGGKTITWGSTDRKVFTVSKTGLVKAVGAGTAKAVAKIGGKSYSMAIQVAPKAKSTGKVINIWTRNEEFKQVFETYYPDGTVNGVTVKWTINPSIDNGYQLPLDYALMDSANKSADEKIDIFLIEPDYSEKYVNSDYVLPLSAIGITEANTKNMYNYTKQIGTNDCGNLTAVSWQATPGVFAYRRSIAKDVLGTDDPAKVAKAISTWDKFESVAAKAKDKGYYMVSTVDEMLKAFIQSSDQPLVKNGTINLHSNALRWIEMSKDFYDKGYTAGNGMWTWEWMNDLSANGKVFGFFYSTWGVNFTLPMNGADASGDWAICAAPADYNWGSSYLCAASSTDNAKQVADIIKTICCNTNNMKKMTADMDYSNNSAANKAVAKTEKGSEFYGGQKLTAVFDAAAMDIDLSAATEYDLIITDAMMYSFRDYFVGYCTFDESLEYFYDYIIGNYYPNLKKPAKLPKEP